jgi:DNA-binding helix-turn-helix protein
VYKLQIDKLSPAHGEKGGNIKMKNERLIRARIQCGYTQSEIAAKAKISLRAYQNYESGRR